MKANTIILSAALVISASLHAWRIGRDQDVAYVRSRDVVHGYFGMKEAMAIYEEAAQVEQLQIDSMRSALESAVAEYAQMDQRDRSRRSALEERIARQRNALDRMQRGSNESMGMEESELIKGVLAQVNEHTREFAKERGYRIVLGTTDDGSLMYGEEGLDVTEELIEYMNEAHGGKL
ncbi:MAG: OmpH family outer membrane protein [Flavobacteriales bacterium]|nr:OmpH family outer membrane protein [Flavobacteriales bacterium]